MTKLYSPREVGEILGLPHLEVIRRIRRGDISAAKIGKNGWNWIIQEDAIDTARESDWYKRRLARQNAG